MVLDDVVLPATKFHRLIQISDVLSIEPLGLLICCSCVPTWALTRLLVRQRRRMGGPIRDDDESGCPNARLSSCPGGVLDALYCIHQHPGEDVRTVIMTAISFQLTLLRKSTTQCARPSKANRSYSYTALEYDTIMRLLQCNARKRWSDTQTQTYTHFENYSRTHYLACSKNVCS
jgi:hypothetical protein